MNDARYNETRLEQPTDTEPARRAAEPRLAEGAIALVFLAFLTMLGLGLFQFLAR
jgi:hypothetical protein